jgi:hypothetical protein
VRPQSQPEDLLDGLGESPRWGADGNEAALTVGRIYAADLASASLDKVLSGEMTADEASAWLQEETEKLP